MSIRSNFFEIAYAASHNKLCFFTGTGFSKAITNNNSPSWKKLIELLCEKTYSADELKKLLEQPSELNLQEISQVLSIELQKIDKDIYQEIAEILKPIEISGNVNDIASYIAKRSYEVITTNYDKLVEALAGSDCQSLAPGLPIPRSNSRVKVYHVHGSIDLPSKMVVTSNDYFKFSNEQTYFSKKLSTILHESTVVILGYSLQDENLKFILNKYRDSVKGNSDVSNIFFVSQLPINSFTKDYYYHSYGIRVIDEMEISNFFSELNNYIFKVEKRIDDSIDNLKKVSEGEFKFSNEFISIESSFYEVLSSMVATGLTLDNKKSVKIVGDIISSKMTLTSKSGAWDQYDHLASWLIHLGSCMELKGTSIQDVYLEAVLKSMNTMKKELYLGYSWHSYRAWKSGWSQLISSNKSLIKTFIESSTGWRDALEVVRMD